jgi:hypothetical protein
MSGVEPAHLVVCLIQPACRCGEQAHPTGNTGEGRDAGADGKNALLLIHCQCGGRELARFVLEDTIVGQGILRGERRVQAELVPLLSLYKLELALLLQVLCSQLVCGASVARSGGGRSRSGDRRCGRCHSRRWGIIITRQLIRVHGRWHFHLLLLLLP